MSRLNRFAIMPLVDASHKPQVNFANFANFDIAKIIALDHKLTYTLQPQLMNQIQLNENGSKAIVNSNVLLGFNEQGTINSLKVTESMFEPQDINEFKKVLATYQIPTTKRPSWRVILMSKINNFDNVMITKGTILMSVNFDSYDDDAELIDLSIVF